MKRWAVGLVMLSLTACQGAGGAVTTTPPPVVSTGAATPRPAPPIASDLFKGHLEALIKNYMVDQSVVSCSVTVVYPDSSGQLQREFFNEGTLASGSNTPVDSSTLYEIGSLTKLFTADMLALFVQQGLMKLDDPLQKYLPPEAHVPRYQGQSITLAELATHTSALPRLLNNGPRVTPVNGVMTWGYASEQDIFTQLGRIQLTYAPGSKWLYSNLAFGLLGIAEGRAGNASYEDLVVSKIAAPLGMNDTRITLTADEKAHLAQGYGQQGSKAPPVASSGGMLGAGAMRSNIQDMAAYLVANIQPDSTPLGPVLQMTLRRAADGPNASMAQGLGWEITNPGGPHEAFFKSGATGGFTSYITFSAHDRTGFAALCSGPDTTKVLAPQIVRLMGQPASPDVDNEDSP